VIGVVAHLLVLDRAHSYAAESCKISRLRQTHVPINLADRATQAR
jgi:hypothetical protein